MPYRSVDPAKGKVLKTFANHTDEQIESFLRTAHDTYGSAWSKGPIERRLGVLDRVADQVEARQEELARIAVQEMGKRTTSSSSNRSTSSSIGSGPGRSSAEP